MHEQLRLAILISGGGSTMKSIVEATKPSGTLFGKVKPVVVIASKPGIQGIERACDLDVPVFIINRRGYEKGQEGSDAYEKDLLAALQTSGAEWVSQNGWLPLTPESVISCFEGRIFNQHPGPLDPGHKDKDGKQLHFGGVGMHGLTVPAAVLEFQCLARRIFPDEATIHRVDTGFDGGMVVARREVEIISGDTPESVAQRMLPIEHQLQIDFWGEAYEGHVSEVSRDMPLIYDDESDLLQQAIIYARRAYPNG